MTVFISYSSKDRSFANKVAKNLMDSGVEIWIDTIEIKVGESIVLKINDALEDNDYLALILSPNSVNSKWVKKELSSALMKHLHDMSIIILPILYKDCKIPGIINDLKYADFRESYDVGFEELLASLGLDIKVLPIDPVNKKRKTKFDPENFIDATRKQSIVAELTIEKIIQELSLAIFAKYDINNIDPDEIAILPDSPTGIYALKKIKSLGSISSRSKYITTLNSFDEHRQTLFTNFLEECFHHIKSIIFSESWEVSGYIRTDVIGYKEKKFGTLNLNYPSYRKDENQDKSIYDPFYSYPYVRDSFMLNEEKDSKNNIRYDPLRFYQFGYDGIWAGLRFLSLWAGKQIYYRFAKSICNSKLEFQNYRSILTYIINIHHLDEGDIFKDFTEEKKIILNTPQIAIWHLVGAINSKDDMRAALNGENPSLRVIY